MNLIFRNVVIANADGSQVGDVYVRDGKLVAPFEEEGARVIDGTDKVLMPGAIDVHVHFREPGAEHKEVWETGSKAAAMGGVTTVLDMPNNSPAITNMANLQAKKEIVKGRSYVNYGFHFGGSADLDSLREAEGFAGIKIYMGSSTGDLLVDEPTMWEKIFEVAKEKNKVVIVHAENEERIRERTREMGADPDIRVHAEIRDCECAKIAADAAIQLRERVGNKLHLAHMSTAHELGFMREHAHEDLSCEVCMHHLYFTKDDMTDGYLKMNPPLRTEEDVRTLWEGVRDGSVNCLATDHAPHTVEEKEREPWSSCPSGVPGVEFLLPLALHEVSQNMLDLKDVVRMLCSEPARIFSIPERGRIEEGMAADLVLLDLNEEKTITREMVQSKCAWSPYEGYTLKGWPVMTIVNGEVVMENGEMVGSFAGKDLF